MKKLNIGCGRDILPGWTNIDYVKFTGIDMCFDLNKLPYPFEDCEIDEILMSHCLEHLENPILVIEELARILKQGAKLTIKVPHFSSSGAFSPLHRTYWHSRIFNHYVNGTRWQTNSLDERTSLIFNNVDKKIVFTKGIFFFNYIIEFFVNINDTAQL